MKVTITIEVPSGTLEEDAVLERIESLLENSNAIYAWEEGE